ncbi:5-formyltetrahydrofolate cyclo-ligase [Succinimonas amylolytica]|uniref:5-formyltetrahydrofolate cyclo-ligase n=1 Tax=Succinimonas amylolytica TaxID=83769 RepID=UPI00036BFBED|nr:5-formyltetrahydrofolate cyclo-ligase [Succinimonas amylolytica]
MPTSRPLLRQKIRDLRKTITPEQHAHYSAQLVDRFMHHERINRASCIALYMSVDGEIDTAGVINWCLNNNIRVALPVLHPFSKGHLLFLNYDKNTVMVNNKYGIPEPELDVRNVIPLNRIDIMCTPLVAYDSNGNRLGMGGGYYDRTLQIYNQTGEGPFPVGLALDIQEVESLPTEIWDVPLPEIITPTRDIIFEKNIREPAGKPRP